MSGYNNLNVGNVLTQSVTGLTPGTTYYYRVRGVNASGTSGNSNVISQIELPDAPVATAGTNLAEGAFDSNWNSVTGATSYRLDVSTSNVFGSFVSGYNDLNVGNVLTAPVTGLTGGTTYYFRVRAVDASGTSANSNVITVLTVPAAPTATAASSVAEVSFSANWNAQTGASSYRLDVSTSNVFGSFVSGFNDLNVGNVTTQAVTGLTGGTTYYFRVRAVNASGTSTNSNVISQLTLPVAPVATAASSVIDVSFSANWGAVGTATGYKLDVSTANDFSSFVSGFNNLDVSNVTTYSVTGLTASTTYYYRVRAYNGSGTGANSNVITQATTASAPSAPTATAGTSVTDVSFSANWGAVGTATGYRLDVATDAGFSSFVTGFNNLDVSNVTTYSVTGLTENTTYYFRIRAYNGGGTSGSSNTITTLTYFTETLDWVTRVVGNGGSVSQGTKDAANTFLGAVTTAGVRSLIYRLNLFAGTGLTACAVPFIKDRGNTLDSLNNFVSGDYSESTGLTGNGNTGARKHIATGFVPATHFNSVTDAHTSFYARSNVNESNNCMIGAVTSGNAASSIYMTLRITLASNQSYGILTGVSSFPIATDSNTLGFYQICRNGTSIVLYKNGSSFASATGASGDLTAPQIFVFAVDDSNLGDQINTTIASGGYSIGRGMDATQSSAFRNAWQAFQTALSRQV